MIHLGFELGTGLPVKIPLAHMAVTGMTQKSGKTTTLEALIKRGNLRAVVFVTKPGEKSFTEGRRILPYFQERADWEYVKDLLEARTGQSLGEKVGYLMRVCTRAKTLQQVRDNIDKELGNRDLDLKKRKVHSSRPSVHEVLAGYIDLILSELKRVPYTDRLEIERGVNIMDLSGIDENIQDMIIRSVVDRIHHHETNAVVVVPEAWKIIPEGGRSLVFDALHSLIREGGTNGNYVWIDAQDIAIVNKKILKSVFVWILGRQQEANEVVRTIKHLIKPAEITPDEIKTLGIGEFLVCFDESTHRVYVQPWYLGELDAQAIAKREETVDTAARIFREKKKHGEIKGVKDAVRAATVFRPDLEAKNVEDAKKRQPHRQQLIQEPPDEQEKNEQNPSRIVPGIPRDATTPLGTRGPVESARANDGQNKESARQSKDGDGTARAGRIESRITNHESRITEDEPMWEERCKLLEKEVARLREIILARDGSIPAVAAEAAEGAAKPSRLAPSNGSPSSIHSPLATSDFESLYAQIKQRAAQDVGILQLLAARPELRVTIEPKILEVDEDSARGQVAKLIHEGFFKEPRNGNAACQEILEKRRFKGARVSVSRALDDITGMGFLVKDKEGFVATSLKVSVRKGSD